MNFERIQEKKLKYEQNKHKISPVTLSSYEKDFELTFTHNSTPFSRYEGSIAVNSSPKTREISTRLISSRITK